MLTAYQAVVKNGHIQFREAIQLPEGAQVVVVVASPLAEVLEQEQRLAAMPSTEWQKPFTARLRP